MRAGWHATTRLGRFNSGLALTVSIGAALGFALGVVIIFEGEARWFWLYYYVPITVPFVAFLFDRLSQRRRLSRFAAFVDVPVVAIAFLRALVLIPFISGHALFLTYALLTTQSSLARVTAALVLIEVILIKVFVWHDVTLIGGIALGIAAGLLFRSNSLYILSQKRAKQTNPLHGEVSFNASEPDA